MASSRTQVKGGLSRHADLHTTFGVPITQHHMIQSLGLDYWPPTHGQAGVHAGDAERVPNHALSCKYYFSCLLYIQLYSVSYAYSTCTYLRFW